MRAVCLDWLLAACCVWLGRESPRREAGAGLDWAVVERLAYIHNLEPLLHALARDGGLPPGEPPAALGERWERAYFQNYRFNARLLRALDRFLVRSRALGLPLVVFKGPVTAARAWGDPALRVMHDVDLLCRESDLEALCRIARDLGFVGAGETAVYHLALTSEELGLGIELHFDLYDFLHGGADLLQSILEQPVTVELEGIRLPAAATETAVLLEVAHLVNHDLQVNLKPWLDLAALVARAPLDRTALRRLAARHDLLRELDLTIGMTAQLFRLPANREASPMAVPLPLANQVRDFLLRLDLDYRQPPLAEAAARSHPRARLRYLRRLLFPRLSHLRALHGLDSRTQALLAWAGHLAATAERGWHKWRARGTDPANTSGESMKRRVYERHAGQSG